MSQVNFHQGETTQNNQELKQGEAISSRKVKDKKSASDAAVPKQSEEKVGADQIKKANELMMQAWDMISKRKKSDSNAQSDL